MKPSESCQFEQLTVKVVSSAPPLDGLAEHEPLIGDTFFFKITSLEPSIMTPFIVVETVKITFQWIYEYALNKALGIIKFCVDQPFQIK